MKRPFGLPLVAALLLITGLFLWAGTPALAQPAPAAGDIPKIQ